MIDSLISSVFLSGFKHHIPRIQFHILYICLTQTSADKFLMLCTPFSHICRNRCVICHSKINTILMIRFPYQGTAVVKFFQHTLWLAVCTGLCNLNSFLDRTFSCRGDNRNCTSQLQISQCSH